MQFKIFLLSQILRFHCGRLVFQKTKNVFECMASCSSSFVRSAFFLAKEIGRLWNSTIMNGGTVRL